MAPFVDEYSIDELERWKDLYTDKCRRIHQLPLNSRSARPIEARTAYVFAGFVVLAVLLALRGSMIFPSWREIVPVLVIASIITIRLVRLVSERSIWLALGFMTAIGALSASATFVVSAVSAAVLQQEAEMVASFLRVTPLIAIGFAVALAYTVIYYFLIELRRYLNRPTSLEYFVIDLVLTILYEIREGESHMLHLHKVRLSIGHALRNVADALWKSLQGEADRTRHVSPQINRRVLGAVASVRELEAWIVLPQVTTVASVRRRLYQLLAALVTGQLHHLPYSDPLMTTPRPRLGWTRIAFNLAGGAAPALLLIVASTIGLIPEAWREAATAIGVLSIVLGAANAFRPGAAASLREAQELATSIGSPRP